MPKPNFPHTCRYCRYLGSLGTQLDFYLCERDAKTAHVMARHGAEPSEYTVMPVNLLVCFQTHTLGTPRERILVDLLLQNCPSIISNLIQWEDSTHASNS